MDNEHRTFVSLTELACVRLVMLAPHLRNDENDLTVVSAKPLGGTNTHEDLSRVVHAQ